MQIQLLNQAIGPLSISMLSTLIISVISNSRWDIHAISNIPGAAFSYHLIEMHCVHLKSVHRLSSHSLRLQKSTDLHFYPNHYDGVYKEILNHMPSSLLMKVVGWGQASWGFFSPKPMTTSSLLTTKQFCLKGCCKSKAGLNKKTGCHQVLSLVG